MAWITGVVTYADAKTGSSGKQFGIVSIEGISMFCKPEFLPVVGAEVRAFVTSQSQKKEDGTYDNSLNALTVQPVNGQG